MNDDDTCKKRGKKENKVVFQYISQIVFDFLQKLSMVSLSEETFRSFKANSKRN
jgi:hypothetical protein